MAGSVTQLQDRDTFRLNMLDHLVDNLRSRIVRDGEIDSEAVDQIEDRFAAKVQTLAIPSVGPVDAANLGHVEIGQFQELS
jgi:hypothetical protein